ncbi:MAG: NADH-quinone oxidoreductase subunit E [Alphaproteobacteria bacterium]|nr:NADH-quinone oxidoreductase subunit E [Alphaproteobacteria bacterium]
MTGARPQSDSEARVARILAEHEGVEGGCLMVLQAIQRAFGYVPQEALAPVARALGLSQADVHGVLTFYHDLRRAPAGRRLVRVCQAEACQAMGARSLTDALSGRLGVALGGTSEDGVSLEPVYCLGNCALSPAVTVDGVMQGRATEDRVMAALEDAT